MRYWLVLNWSYMLASRKASALLCSQQELSMKLKSTATHVGTLAQYAWHAASVVGAAYKLPPIALRSTNVVHCIAHGPTIINNETVYDLIRCGFNVRSKAVRNQLISSNTHQHNTPILLASIHLSELSQVCSERSRSLYAIAGPSVVCLSFVVCNVRAPYSGATLHPVLCYSSDLSLYRCLAQTGSITKDFAS